MQSSNTAEQDVVEQIYHFAAELMQRGSSDRDVTSKLVAQGLDAEVAGIVVRNLRHGKSKVIRQAGQRNMLYGTLWWVGGIIVTALTYEAAKEGGSYIVAWGAVVFGAIQFFRGLLQAIFGK